MQISLLRQYVPGTIISGKHTKIHINLYIYPHAICIISTKAIHHGISCQVCMGID